MRPCTSGPPIYYPHGGPKCKGPWPWESWQEEGSQGPPSKSHSRVWAGAVYERDAGWKHPGEAGGSQHRPLLLPQAAPALTRHPCKAPRSPSTRRKSGRSSSTFVAASPWPTPWLQRDPWDPRRRTRTQDMEKQHGGMREGQLPT